MMEINTQVAGKMEMHKDMENYIGKMEEFIKDNLKIINYMEEEL